MTRTTRSKAPIILWSAVTLYFAFQFILRLIPGILREDIMQKFMVDDVSFGQLAGFYYLGYSGMQLPMGYMLDRYNTKYIVSLSIILAAIGTFIFSFASNWQFLLFGRFLIGAGSAVAFLSVAKVTALYFPKEKQSSMIGLSFTIGLTGGVMGGAPTRMLIDTYGFTNSLNLLGIFAIICASLVFLSFTLVSKNESMQQESKVPFTETLKIIFSPKILYMGICGGLMVGSLEGFTDVWAIAYFEHVYKFSHLDSISATSIVYIGMCFGGAILGFCADRFKSTIPMILIIGAINCTIFAIFFFASNPSYYFVASIMFLLGILCCYQVLVFGIATKTVSAESAGITIAVINCINTSFGYLFHVLISSVIQANWKGQLSDNGVPVYDLNAYLIALSPVPILCMLGAVGFLYFYKSR